MLANPYFYIQTTQTKCEKEIRNKFVGIWIQRANRFLYIQKIEHENTMKKHYTYIWHLSRVVQNAVVWLMGRQFLFIIVVVAVIVRVDASSVTLVTCYTPNYKNIFEMCVLFSTWICRYTYYYYVYIYNIDLYVWCYKTYFQACITMTTNSIQSFVTAQQSVCISLNFPFPLFPILVVVINANAWIDKCIWFW